MSLEAQASAAALADELRQEMDPTFKRETHGYGVFLKGKVDAARVSMQAGHGQPNDQIEAKFAARRHSS
jgi:hypothetical protein